MVIYVITDNTNGKQYVGQTIHSAELRFAQHCKPSETSCRLLDRAISAHGRENFSVSVLEAVNTAEELDEREVYWISKLNTLAPNGYNIEGGGKGKGFVSEETRRRLSVAMVGKFDGEKNPFYGKHHTQGTRQKMRDNHWDMRGENNPNYGKHLSEETRRKLSESRKGVLTGVDNHAARAVICIETGRVYPTIREAAASVGISYSSLSQHLRGRSFSCAKLHWEYYEEGEK